MRKNIKYYLIYCVIFIVGASSAAALYFAYEKELFTGIGKEIMSYGSSLSLGGYLLFSARLLKPLLAVFLTAFTIYSCAVGAGACLYSGASFGAFLMKYCISGLNPFTHVAVLVFLLLQAAIYTVFSTRAALYRGGLTSVAPQPEEILKKKSTLSLFYLFLSVSAVTLALSFAVYLFVIYFPI